MQASNTIHSISLRCTVLFFSMLVLVSCSNLKKPEFKKIRDLEIIEINEEGLKFRAVAVHHNPNPVSGTIDESIIHIIINELEIGTIDQKLDIEVLAYKDFEYDFEFSLNHMEILKGKDLLGKLYNIIFSKELQVDFRGDTKCKFMNIPFTIPLEHQEIIEFNF